MQRAQAMGHASINSLLLRFAGPSIVTMLVMGSYNVVDAIFVGRLGSDALAALTVSFPFMMLFVAVGVGTGIGATSLISRYLGTGDHLGANRAAAVSFTLVAFFGIVITAVFLPNLEGMLRLFGARETVMPLAKEYMSILVTFAVFTFFPMIIGSIIRAEGNPILPSVTGVISVGLNIALDPVLIFGLGPAPELGIAGAAWATVIARGVGAVILLGYFITGRSSFRFRPGYFIPKIRILVEIYRVGASQVVQMGAEAAIMGFGNTIAGSFGVIPLAVLGVIMRASSFIFMPCVGLIQGALPLIGFNFGGARYDRIGEIIGKTGLLAIIWSLVFFVVALAFPESIISIFRNEPEFVSQGARALRMFALSFPFIGAQLLAGSFFQGIGKGIPSLVLASARHAIFLLPALLILPRLFDIDGLWAAFPVSSLLAMILSIAWMTVQFRGMNMKLRFRAAPPEQSTT